MIEDEYKVRLIFDEEIEAAAELSAAVFGDQGYSKRDFFEAVKGGNALVLGAFSRSDMSIKGYGVFYHSADQAEINSLAIAEDQRRKGLGTFLLKKAAGILKEGGAKKLFLEVRRSNEGAIKFYEKHRFLMSDVRRNFYDNPKEDALVMVKVLKL